MQQVIIAAHVFVFVAAGKLLIGSFGFYLEILEETGHGRNH
jgi:hypothetical protein